MSLQRVRNAWEILTEPLLAATPGQRDAVRRAAVTVVSIRDLLLLRTNDACADGISESFGGRGFLENRAGVAQHRPVRPNRRGRRRLKHGSCRATQYCASATQFCLPSPRIVFRPVGRGAPLDPRQRVAARFHDGQNGPYSRIRPQAAARINGCHTAVIGKENPFRRYVPFADDQSNFQAACSRPGRVIHKCQKMLCRTTRVTPV